MARLKVLHLSLTPFVGESRVEKEIGATVAAFADAEVRVCALLEPELAETEERTWGVVHRLRLTTRRLPTTLITQVPKYIEWLWRALAVAREFRPTVVQCHSLVLLPVGYLAKLITRARLVYDAHELETERQGLSGVRQVLSRFVERLFIRRADAMLVVSETIGQWYRERFPGVEPMVVRNIALPAAQSADSASSDLKQQLNMGANESLFIYQGLLGPGRGIERLLETFPKAQPGRHLALMGSGPMEARVREVADANANVHWVPPVKPQEVLGVTRSADVGISLIENTCLSYYYSLPNKLFEYLLAGLPVMVPDFPEMKRLVDELGCGWIVDEGEESLARLIDTIEPCDVENYKSALASVDAKLSWSREVDPLMDCYGRWQS